jgi:hypothetical protein
MRKQPVDKEYYGDLIPGWSCKMPRQPADSWLELQNAQATC